VEAKTRGIEMKKLLTITIISLLMLIAGCATSPFCKACYDKGIEIGPLKLVHNHHTCLDDIRDR
jgi:hypothetical protein